MKLKYCILLLACFGLLMLSCRKEQKNTPEAVTEAFAQAYYTADFENQTKFSNEKSHLIIESVKSGVIDNPSQLEKLKNNKVEFVSTSVDNLTDSTASCTCKVLLNGQPRQDTWSLVKEDDKWKVTLSMP